MTARDRGRRTRCSALVAALLITGCTVSDDAPDEDLFVQMTRVVRDLDAGLEAGGVADLRRRAVDGPTRCEDGDRFRGRASAAGYVTDGADAPEILGRVREAWASEAGELVDVEVGEDRPTIARLGDDGIRYEARVFLNRSDPLLSLEIRTDCTGVPEGYEDPDGLHDRLYDDFRPSVDPAGEQRNDPLDPAPSD